MVKYSLIVGNTRMNSSARKPMTMAHISSPNNVMPRWWRCLRSSTVIRGAPDVCCAARRSIERADALEVAEIHPHEKRLADDVLVGHEAPEPRVARIVAVVAHHEVVARRHFARHALRTVAAVFLERKVVGHADIRLALLVDQDAVLDAVELLDVFLLEAQ